MVLLVSAFGGAGLLVYDDIESLRNILETFRPEEIIFYVVALGGAIMAAGENISLRIVRDRAGIQRSVENTIFLSATARIPFFLYGPIAYWLLDVPPLLPAGAVLNLLVIIVGWTVASVLFTYAVLKTERSEFIRADNVSLSNIGSIAYLSPVSNAILLSIFFPEEQLAGLAIVGISLVVLSNLLINADMRYVTALSGTMIATIWLCVVTAITPPEYNIYSTGATYFFSIAEVTGGVFAILVSFTLWRLSDSGKALQRYLWQIGEAMQDVVSAYRAEVSTPSTQVVSLADKLLCLLVRDALLGGARSKSRKRHQEALEFGDFHTVLIEMRTHMENDAGYKLDKTEIYGPYRRLDGLVDSWTIERRARLTLGEMIIMSLLGIITVVSVYTNRAPGAISDLLAVFFSSGVIFLLLCIRDLNRNRWNFSQESLTSMERLFEAVGSRPYVPREVVDSGELEGPDETKLVRTESVLGGFVERELSPRPVWMNSIVSVLLALGVAAGVLLLILQN